MPSMKTLLTVAAIVIVVNILDRKVGITDRVAGMLPGGK